jgi:amino acid transporter
VEESETQNKGRHQRQHFQPPRQQYMPTDNLNIFATLHVVKGILTILFSLFFLFFIFLASLLSLVPLDKDSHTSFNAENLIIIIAVAGFLITVTIGILTLLAGKYIKERRNYNFIFAISILNCTIGLLGIILGIFTILDLNKSHVKAQFEPGYDPQYPFGH